MRSGAAVPAVPSGATLAEAVLEISRKGLGMTTVQDPAGRLVGLFTDGDLRRQLERGVDFRATRIDEVMTRAPRTVRPETLAAEAVQVMEAHRITQLAVLEADGRVAGALNIHDLFRAKIV
jgi:arabinose-5-phosphate isomerase